MLNSSLYAGGTMAGTMIKTSPSINYNLSGEQYSHELNTTAITVEHLSNLVATALVTEPVLANMGKGSHIPFKVTNIGNGTDYFKLQNLNVNDASSDDFDVNFGTAYIDYMGDSNNTMRPFDLTQTISLEAGQSLKVVMTNTMPSEVALNAKSQIKLSALSQESTRVDNNISAIGEYQITDISQEAVVINKSSEVKEMTDGQLVSFLLAIHVRKPITKASLRNPIEGGGEYQEGSLFMDGTALSVEKDADMAEISNNILTVNLSNVQAGEIYYINYDVLVRETQNELIPSDTNETLG